MGLEVEFLIKVRTRECVHYIGKMCTSEYIHMEEGERRLVLNAKDSTYRW
jgi:hypothetical protein